MRAGLLRALLALAVLAEAAMAAGELNIFGQPLQSCSQPGTAMTGFTRDGRCADVGLSDAGAHHVCIQMKSDFCTVTGQPDWCTTRDFPCMAQRGQCKIGNWCVCQWAFSNYLERAGGCDAIVDLVCGATHKEAFDAYTRSGKRAHKEALECIKRRCGFYDEKPQVNSTSENSIRETSIADKAGVATGGAGTEEGNATCNALGKGGECA